MPRRLVSLCLAGVFSGCVVPVPAPERPDGQGADLAALRLAVAELQVRVAASRTAAEPRPPAPAVEPAPVQVVPLAQLHELLAALAAKRPEVAAQPTVAAPRYQVAGTGEASWKTVLDTATGVVFNYRQDETGRMRWVAITPPLHTAK